MLALLAAVAAYYGVGPLGTAACAVRVTLEGGRCPLDCWTMDPPPYKLSTAFTASRVP